MAELKVLRKAMQEAHSPALKGIAADNYAAAMEETLAKAVPAAQRPVGKRAGAARPSRPAWQEGPAPGAPGAVAEGAWQEGRRAGQRT